MMSRCKVDGGVDVKLNALSRSTSTSPGDVSRLCSTCLQLATPRCASAIPPSRDRGRARWRARRCSARRSPQGARARNPWSARVGIGGPGDLGWWLQPRGGYRPPRDPPARRESLPVLLYLNSRVDLEGPRDVQQYARRPARAAASRLWAGLHARTCCERDYGLGWTARACRARAISRRGAGDTVADEPIACDPSRA